jgi:uncharacterized protein YbaA (DUF1428 family)
MNYLDGFVAAVPLANKAAYLKHAAGWEKAMADPRMDPANAPMPFDGKRMIYGGFQVVLEA